MVIDAKASFGRAKQIYGRERFSRPRSETIERKLRLLSGLDVHKDVVVFLFGALSLPIEVRRVALRHLDVRPTGKDWVLFSASSTKQEVLHAIHFVELGRVHMPVKDDDVRSLAYEAIVLWGFWSSGMAPMPERQKVGLWKAMKIFLIPDAFASSSHTLSCFICSSYVGRVALQPVGAR